MNNWIRHKLYNVEKLWHTFKLVRRFRKIGIPRTECEVCKRGVVEWRGYYLYVENSKSYDVCEFCKHEMNNFVCRRYEIFYMAQVELGVRGK